MLFLNGPGVEEQGDTHQGITAIMQIGHDDPAIPSPPMTAFTSFILFTTFTTYRTGRKIFAPCFNVMSFSARVDERLLTVFPFVLPSIIGHSHQRIFFTEHTAVFTYKQEPVYIRVNRYARDAFL